MLIKQDLDQVMSFVHFMLSAVYRRQFVIIQYKVPNLLFALTEVQIVKKSDKVLDLFD